MRGLLGGICDVMCEAVEFVYRVVHVVPMCKEYTDELDSESAVFASSLHKQGKRKHAATVPSHHIYAHFYP